MNICLINPMFKINTHFKKKTSTFECRNVFQAPLKYTGKRWSIKINDHRCRRINQIAGKCKKIGWVAHPVSAVTTCFEKYILEGLKSQTVQGCFQNFLKNHFLLELFWRVLPCWCCHSVGDPADYHDLVVWGQVLGLRLKIDNADLKNNVKIFFSNKLSKYSYC